MPMVRGLCSRRSVHRHADAEPAIDSEPIVNPAAITPAKQNFACMMIASRVACSPNTKF